MYFCLFLLFGFVFNDTATTEIYTRKFVGSVRGVEETGVELLQQVIVAELPQQVIIVELLQQVIVAELLQQVIRVELLLVKVV